MNLLKKYLPILLLIFTLFFMVFRLELLLLVISRMLVVSQPVMLGFVIAFILNILYKELSKIKFYRKHKGLAILTTYTSALVLFIVLVLFVVPPVVDSASAFIGTLPNEAKNASEALMKFAETLNIRSSVVEGMLSEAKNILMSITSITAKTALSLVNTTISLTNQIMNLLLAFVLSIYMLLDKEKLIGTFRILNRRIFPARVSQKLEHIFSVSGEVFTSFVRGQITEALILGGLCAIGMSLLGLPYTPLVSVLIGVTALIPYVGAFIGVIPSVLIIALTSLQSAFVFLVFILILQQFDGNVIYPRVVGSAIGLSPFWVLFSIIVCGGLFGLGGMLVGVPLFAVAFQVAGIDSK